jgi:hypothetical protein
VINGASADGAGGAVGGEGSHNTVTRCTLKGVSFDGCTAPDGRLLSGNVFTGAVSGGPVYTVKPGCSVDGTVITGANWSSVLSGNNLCLENGSTIAWSP